MEELDAADPVVLHVPDGVHGEGHSTRSLRGLIADRAALAEQRAAAAAGRCSIDRITQFECSYRAAVATSSSSTSSSSTSSSSTSSSSTSSDNAAILVCYPVQRYFWRCADAPSIEITAIVTPRDARARHRMLHGTAPSTCTTRRLYLSARSLICFVLTRIRDAGVGAQWQTRIFLRSRA